MAYVSFKGNVGRVNDLKYTKDGTPLVSFSVAENHSKKVEDEWVEGPPTWWSVTLFGKAAEKLSEQLHPGSGVSVGGRSKTGVYEAKDGTEKERLEVSAEHVGII